MKKIVLSIAVIFTALIAKAQFDLRLESASISGSSSNFELICHGYMTNTSSTNGTFAWQLSTNNAFPSAWGAAICDNNQCYDTGVVTANFNVNAGDSSIMEIHVYPFMVGGDGEITVTINNVSDPFDLVEGKVTFNAWTLSNGKISKKKTGIEIYPNPTTNKLNVTLDVKKEVNLEVYNVLGQLKINHTHKGGTSVIDLTDLPAGVYFIKYTNDANQVISKQFKKIQ